MQSCRFRLLNVRFGSKIQNSIVSVVQYQGNLNLRDYFDLCTTDVEGMTCKGHVSDLGLISIYFASLIVKSYCRCPLRQSPPKRFLPPSTTRS